MSETIYLQGHCDHCHEAIEFPAESSGQSAACPICSRITRFHVTEVKSPLVAGGPARPGTARARKRNPFIVLGISVVLLIDVVGAWFWLSRSKQQPATSGTPLRTIINSTNAPSNSDTKAPDGKPVASPAKARSLDDLKAGSVTLEKAKGSSLVYAVGVLRNESEHQRFGVTIEVELTDAGGNNAGLAKDYRAVIEPRQEWRFRALILNSKAVRGAVTRIHEE